MIRSSRKTAPVFTGVAGTTMMPGLTDQAQRKGPLLLRHSSLHADLPRRRAARPRVVWITALAYPNDPTGATPSRGISIAGQRSITTFSPAASARSAAD